MRLLHKLRARLFGYFWLPCPVCGRMFGGHEIRHVSTASLIAEDGRAYCVCPNPQCSHDAAVLNMAHGYGQMHDLSLLKGDADAVSEMMLALVRTILDRAK